MADSFLTKWERVIKVARRDGPYQKKPGRPAAWSSGRDEDFGGRFFCFHGLSDEEHAALKALADKGLASLVGQPQPTPPTDCGPHPAAEPQEGV